MKIRTKLYFIVGFALLTMGAAIVASTYFAIVASEAKELKLVANEFLEETADVIETASAAFFVHLHEHLGEGTIEARRARLLEFADQLDEARIRLVVFDRHGNSHRDGAAWDAVSSRVTPRHAEEIWRHYESSGQPGSILENFAEVLESSGGEVVPYYFQLELLDELGLVVGFGRELALLKARLGFLERTGRSRFERLLLESIAIIGGTILLLLLGVGGLLRVTLLRPLEVLVEGLGRFSAGDLGHRVRIRAGDELKALCDAFNSMAARLSETLETAHSSEAALSTTLDSLVDAVVAMDADGRIVRMNPAAERLTGWVLAEARGQPLEQVLRLSDSETRAPLENPALRVLSSGEEVRIAEGTRLTRRDGESVPIAGGGASTRSADGTVDGVVLVLRDISRERELEENLRQAQRMETVGQLAGGVAHDFNNLLLVIFGHVDLARRRGENTGPRLGADLDEIERSAMRAADLTRQLLVFSRKQPIRSEPLDLLDVVGGLRPLLRRLIPESIRIEFSGATNRCVNADRGQIEQVLTNVCVNARDAMPEGGVLSIAVEDAAIDEVQAERHHWARPGSYVRLSVSDTGRGIAGEIRERIFEPFFTTKEPGFGTGLGLSVVYGVCSEHKALIELESESGRGTTFRFWFPEGTRAGADVEPPGPDALPSGTERILVVEDDDAVRELSAEFLQEAGYEVVTAADGIEALKIIRACSEDIDLLLLDDVMPRLGGTAVRAELVRLGIDLPVVLCSGYGATLKAEAGESRAYRVLRKPFQRGVLLRTIRSALDAVRSG